MFTGLLVLYKKYFQILAILSHFWLKIGYFGPEISSRGLNIEIYNRNVLIAVKMRGKSCSYELWFSRYKISMGKNGKITKSPGQGPKIGFGQNQWSNLGFYDQRHTLNMVHFFMLEFAQ